jgi:hypothetical protein
MIDTYGNDVVAATAALNFNASVINVQGIGGGASNFSVIAEQLYSNSAGTIQITRGQAAPGVNSSSAILDRITFRGIAAGTGQVTVSLANSIVVVRSATGQLATLSVAGGTYTFSITPAAAYCGDGTCNGSDTCSNCPGDCGACAPVCGDGSCNGTETCSSCSSDCGACADFSITASPSAIRAPQSGTSQPTTITVQSLNGFNSPVTLSIQGGMPSGATAAFSVNPVNGSGNSTLTINTSNVAGGSYSVVVRATSGSISHTYTISFTVVSLSVTLTAATNSSSWQDPLNGYAPLNGVDFRAVVSGTSVNILYDFDCTNDGTWDGAQVNSGNATVVVADRCNYPGIGNYTARVRVQSDVANWAYDTVTISVTSAPPSANNLSYTSSDYCTSPPQGTFHWIYSDPTGDSQSAYQVQVDDSSSFSAPLVTDSGKVMSTTGNSYTPSVGVLQYNRTYYWRVMVWDSYNVPSAWAVGSSFQTPQHAYPSVTDIHWTPAVPSAHENTTFTADTICYVTGGGTTPCPTNGQHYMWTFVGANQSPVYGPAATVSFSNSGPASVSLRIIDQDNYDASCSAQRSESLNIQLPLPGWEEVPPQ